MHTNDQGTRVGNFSWHNLLHWTGKGHTAHTRSQLHKVPAGCTSVSLSRGSTFKVSCHAFPGCTHSFCTTSSSFLHSLSHLLTLTATQIPLHKRLLAFSCQEGTQCWDLHTTFHGDFKVPSIGISTDTANMVRVCQQNEEWFGNSWEKKGCWAK